MNEYVGLSIIDGGKEHHNLSYGIFHRDSFLYRHIQEQERKIKMAYVSCIGNPFFSFNGVGTEYPATLKGEGVSTMPDNEFMSIKEAIREVSNKVDDIHESVNSLRVEIADKYVKKEDFEKVQAENNDVHKTLYGWLIGLLVAVIGGVIGIISNILK